MRRPATMIVFGEGARSEEVGSKLGRIRRLTSASLDGRGIEAHAAVVAALIEAGELAQGLADRDFAAYGSDRTTAPVSAAMDVAVALARAMASSWANGLNGPDRNDRGALCAALREFEACTLPDDVEVRAPEGFAHYALYPEAFLAAAGHLPADVSEVRVIGIRSIGTTLAATIAAGSAAVRRPVTVRPVGHPYRRELRLSDELAAELVGSPDAIYAVADEGPGRSGSSFAAVASFLDQAGVPSASVQFFPSHGGEPGPEASPEIRGIWARVPRHHCTFDDFALDPSRPVHHLAGWVADLTGSPTGPLADLSGGRWREHRRWPDGRDPPVNAWQERRKFLLSSESGPWLLRFAGLDRSGERKHGMARELGEAGFTPACAGLRHGFTVERWHGAARAVGFDGAERAGLLDRIGSYLGFRARRFRPDDGISGASLEALYGMARHNAGEGLGEAAARRLEVPAHKRNRLAKASVPVLTDNRLHAWEWIDADGHILKTDALDHHAGHDLIGPQDVAWDIAGASVELGLSKEERATLAGRVQREAGRAVDAELVDFLLPCYLAFWLGACTFAKDATSDPAEIARLEAERLRYAHGLAITLELA